VYQNQADLSQVHQWLSTSHEANTVIVINEGEIVEQGIHQQLLDKRGFFQYLYIGQSKGQEF
jgi:ABC-type transport system involved in Fe-S cluster assembly fused permease/ATPase subunit